ncbi:MAG: aldehyde dehydrogenase family protein [Candidatus Kapaibacterium sp.]
MEAEKFIIENEFVQSDSFVEIINPYTNKVVKKVYKTTKEQVNVSLNYLSSVFQKFKLLPAYRRGELLEKVSIKISERREDLARLITLETGKPIKFSFAEMDRAIFTFKTGAEEAKRIEGEIIPLDQFKGAEGKSGYIKRFPVGVILGITPWNFPVNLVAHKIAPALASGNTLLLKPASASLCSGIEIVKIIKEVCDEMGLGYCPVNVVTSSGSEIEEFLADDRVKMISFTGSPLVGWSIKKKLSKQRISLELGGNAGVIVDETADIDAAIPKIITGGFYGAGQSCISVQRVYVHRNLYEAFEKKMVDAANKVVYGDPDDENCLAGPMINETEAKRAERWIQEAIESGGKLLTGGKRDGAVLEPTLMIDVPIACNINSKEVFAPIMVLKGFINFKQVVEELDNSDYGLQAGIFTNNLSNAMYAYENIEAGGIVINEVSAFRVDSMPYGGLKLSGMGKEGIKYAIEEMTERKILII